MTLTEVLVASTVAVVVIIAITRFDVNRMRLEKELRERSGLFSEQHRLILAINQITIAIQQADRVTVLGILGHNTLQVRIPVGCSGATPPDPSCFDNAADYQWDQYGVTTGELRWYQNIGTGCNTPTVLAKEIALFGVSFTDQASPPPGGDPPGQDNNLLWYTLRWDNGLTGSEQRAQEFQGHITSRAISYSNLNGTATDSGSGLAPPGTGNPPGAPCP